jgi:hypothetical protein
MNIRYRLAIPAAVAVASLMAAGSTVVAGGAGPSECKDLTFGREILGHLIHVLDDNLSGDLNPGHGLSWSDGVGALPMVPGFCNPRLA